MNMQFCLNELFHLAMDRVKVVEVVLLAVEPLKLCFIPPPPVWTIFYFIQFQPIAMRSEWNSPSKLTIQSDWWKNSIHIFFSMIRLIADGYGLFFLIYIYTFDFKKKKQKITLFCNYTNKQTNKQNWTIFGSPLLKSWIPSFQWWISNEREKTNNLYWNFNLSIHPRNMYIYISYTSLVRSVCCVKLFTTKLELGKKVE